MCAENRRGNGAGLSFGTATRDDKFTVKLLPTSNMWHSISGRNRSLSLVRVRHVCRWCQGL